MLARLIEDFTAALCWARAARSYIAARHGRPRLVVPVFAFVLCPDC